jgi:hypothetical protein
VSLISPTAQRVAVIGHNRAIIPPLIRHTSQPASSRLNMVCIKFASRRQQMGVLHGARRSQQTFFTEEVSGGCTFFVTARQTRVLSERRRIMCFELYCEVE